MKMILILALVLSTFSAFAEQVEVFSAQIGMFGNTSVDTSFQMDKDSGDGSARVVVTSMTYGPTYPGPVICDRFGCRPGYPYPPTPMYTTILDQTVKIDGLRLDGDNIMYEGREGTVQCGKMGYTRVFHRPAVYLNGNCKLSGKISYQGMVTVDLITK